MLSAITLSGAATVESGFLQASHLGFAVVPKQQQSGRQRGTASEAEVSSLDEIRADLERARDRLAECETEVAALRADLAELRRAHDAQARHLVIERLTMAEASAAFASEVEELKADVEWRTSVMKTYEEQLEALRTSRSVRYAAPLRRLAGVLRTRRS